MQTDVCRVSARRAPVSLQSVLADEHAWREIPHRTKRSPVEDVVIGYWADDREARREMIAPMLLALTASGFKMDRVCSLDIRDLL